MATIRRILGIKTPDEARAEVAHQPHVEEARKQLDRFYASVQDAERSLVYHGPDRRRGHR